MEQCHDRATASEPDGRLSGRVASPDHADPRGAAELRLGRSGRIEDADPLVLGEAVDGEPPVLRPCREQDGARRNLAVILQPDDVASVPRFE